MLVLKGETDQTKRRNIEVKVKMKESPREIDTLMVKNTRYALIYDVSLRLKKGIEGEVEYA
ncbi:MAG: hypothetical protein QXD41_03345 [Nitrososphaeria archaeon]